MLYFHLYEDKAVLEMTMDFKISLPNEVSEEAQRIADEMQISLDELFTLALAHYLTHQQGEHVTKALDALYATEASALDPGLKRLQTISIRDEQW